MIAIKITNSLGESLVLSPAEDKFRIKKVSGLSPQGGTISTQKMAKHGTRFANSTTDERNIVIDLNVVGDIEANRDLLYIACPPSMDVIVELQTDKKHATIEGWVETCEVDFFQKITVGQISIICPDPFFKASEVAYAVDAEAVTVKSSCPFETGYGVSVAFTEAAEGFTLTNQSTGKALIITYDFVAGDILEIDTEERTVNINGMNAYNTKSGDWNLLKYGDNQITASSPATLNFIDRYIGM